MMKEGIESTMGCVMILWTLVVAMAAAIVGHRVVSFRKP